MFCRIAVNMKTCPDCKRAIDDDSIYCGYCSAKQPYVPEEEKDEEETVEAAVEAAPAGWRCENCGEQLEQNYDTCWKCGTVRTMDSESPAADGAGAAEAPLLVVGGLGKRLEVYPDKVITGPMGAPGVSGEAAYVPPCEILIKDIVSIEFTEAGEFAPGCMAVNYTSARTDETEKGLNMSESLSFEAGGELEIAKAMALIKRCRADLDAQGGKGERR